MDALSDLNTKKGKTFLVIFVKITENNVESRFTACGTLRNEVGREDNSKD